MATSVWDSVFTEFNELAVREMQQRQLQPNLPMRAAGATLIGLFRHAAGLQQITPMVGDWPLSDDGYRTHQNHELWPSIYEANQDSNTNPWPVLRRFNEGHAEAGQEMS
jgi:hypothetical protein